MAPEQVLAHAAAQIEAAERDTLFRWVQQITRFPAHMQRPEAGLHEVLDHIPVILSHLRWAMQRSPEEQASAPEFSQPGESHALERYRQGVPARVIVKEYQVLRRELWRALADWQPPEPLATAEIFMLAERLNFALDEFMATTLDAFVQLEIETSGTGEGS
jgi:hypothetical protein